MPDGKQYRREADENINNPFNLNREAQNHMDDIPVTAHKATEPNEAPVEAANDDEDERDIMKSFHAFIR